MEVAVRVTLDNFWLSIIMADGDISASELGFSIKHYFHRFYYCDKSPTSLKCQYAIITTILNACEPSGISKRNFRLSLIDTRISMDCWRITRLMSYSQPKILFLSQDILKDYTCN